MGSRVLWRRSATAVGVYGATLLGIAGTVVAARELGKTGFGDFTVAVSAYAFFQLLLDLTVEEALVKFGFRYATAEDWPRFRRLFEIAVSFKVIGGVAAALCLLAAAPLAGAIFGRDRLAASFVAIAALPIAQALENIGASVFILRSRYDLRAYFQTLDMGLRLAGIAIGAAYGAWQACVGMLVAQVLSTSALCAAGLVLLRRFPRAEPAPLGADRVEFRRFLVSSTLGSTLVSMRGTLSTLIVGAVVAPVQAGYFRIAQAPVTALDAASSPARLILLTEQTRDYERGRHDRMYRLLWRYIAGTAALMLVVVPFAWWAMPWLVTFVNGEQYRPAAEAARVLLLVAALRFVWGWTKSFPVSIGRPNLRIWAHSIEIAVLVPLTFVFADRWGATGAAVAMVVSTAVFALTWTVLLVQVRRGGAATVPAGA
jgi:O-antigen/teichoic acid export membrane protein